MQKYIFQCEDCGIKFRLGKYAFDVSYNSKYTAKDGRLIWLTYYDCPKCGKRHYVQIDDVRSNQMKKEVTVMFCRLSKKRLNFKDIPKSQNEKFKKLNKLLEDYRFGLKKEFNGQKLFNENGEEVEVYFSM